MKPLTAWAQRAGSPEVISCQRLLQLWQALWCINTFYSSFDCPTDPAQLIENTFLPCTSVLSSENAKRGQSISQVAQWWRICLPMQEMWVRSLGQEDPLEEEMATVELPGLGLVGGRDLDFGFPWNGGIPRPHQVTWSQPINMHPVRNRGRAEKPADRLSLNKSPRSLYQ